MRIITTILTTILTILVTGCVTFPAPETVAQECPRERVELTTDGHSNERRHVVRVSARCEDDKTLYERVTTTLETTPDEVTTKGTYSARDGNTKTNLASVITEQERGIIIGSVISREEKIGISWGVKTLVTVGH